MSETQTRKSPFLIQEIPCPACGLQNRQRIFRIRMFFAGAKEADGHVMDYRWAEGMEPAHPPYYFLMWCRNCYYTDLFRDYMNPDNSPLIRPLIRLFKKADDDQKALMKRLSAVGDYETIDHPMAIALHLVALYIQMMAKDELLDAFKIGRLLLRIGWLYRESPPDQHTGPVGEFPDLAAFLADVKGQWPFAPISEQEAMEQSLPYFDQGLSNDTAFQDNAAYIQMLSLMIEIMVKCDKLDDAMAVIRSRYRKAATERSNLQALLRKPDLDAIEKRKAKLMIGRMTESIQESGEIRNRLIELLLERDGPKIETILRQTAQQPPEVVEKALADGGIADEIITKLRSQGRIQAVEKKKGFLGFLFG